MIEEILHHLGCKKNLVHNGMNCQSQLVSWISEPSKVLGGGISVTCTLPGDETFPGYQLIRVREHAESIAFFEGVPGKMCGSPG